MLFSSPQGGPSLVSEEFNNMCTTYRVEARIEPFPNPGDPYHPMRKIHFRNFNNHTLVVSQQNRRQTKTTLPAYGECDVMLAPEEPLPGFERGPQ